MNEPDSQEFFLAKKTTHPVSSGGSSPDSMATGNPASQPSHVPENLLPQISTGAELRDLRDITDEQLKQRRTLLKVMGFGGGALVVGGAAGAAALMGNGEGDSEGEPSFVSTGTDDNENDSTTAEKTETVRKATLKEAPDNLGTFVYDGNWWEGGPKGIDWVYDNPNWIKQAKEWRDSVFPNSPEAAREWAAKVKKDNPKGLSIRDRRAENALFSNQFEVEPIEGFENGVVTSDGTGVRFGFTISGFRNGQPLPASLKNRYFVVTRAKDGVATNDDPYMILTSSYAKNGDVLKKAFEEWKEESIRKGIVSN